PSAAQSRWRRRPARFAGRRRRRSGHHPRTGQGGHRRDRQMVARLRHPTRTHRGGTRASYARLPHAQGHWAEPLGDRLGGGSRPRCVAAPFRPHSREAATLRVPAMLTWLGTELAGVGGTVSLAEKIQMLTTNEIALVRASFVRVVPIQSAAADLFYDRLFAISPKLRELFPADLRGQKRKLMQMISTAVGGLNNLNQLIPAVETLGSRHSGYGVTTEHYRLAGAGLLFAAECGPGR